MKIYVASSWRNINQPEMVNYLKGCGHSVYDFRHPAEGENGFQWGEIDSQWQGWLFEDFVRALKHPLSSKGFNFDYDAMRWADACVMMLPCGKSAHLEAGYFVGAGKKLIIYENSKTTEPELMYKMADLITDKKLEVKTALD